MKIRYFLCIALAATALAVPGTQAAPVMRMSDGSTVIELGNGTSAADNAIASGSDLLFVGTVGTHWMLTVTAAGSPQYWVHASNVGAGGTFLDIELSETDFSLDSLQSLVRFLGDIDGKTQGMVTWSMFVDDDNALFGRQHLIGTGTNAGSEFSSEFTNNARIDGTFSMTLHVRINHGNAEGLTSFDFRGLANPTQFVPEPATVLLLALGLLGLAIVGRRRV